MSMDFAPVIDAVKSTRPIIFDKALSSSVKMIDKLRAPAQTRLAD